ncbi:MAG: ATP-binding protein [Planctomycetota bacterium]|nr:ATP-binding protein [Planctomycetota bacterium]
MRSPRFASSLLWTALVWQGLVLAMVIVVFGTVLHWRTRHALFGRVDAGLQDRARMLATSMEQDVITGWDLELEADYLATFTHSGWYEVKVGEGKFVRRGGNVPEDRAGDSVGFFDRADDREFVLTAPKRVRVRVGQSIVAEREELRSMLLFTAVAGAAVLASALVGGWWLATRTLRPIARMSATAGSISERDLTQRIDVSALPGELRDLGTTLNAAFARLESAFERQARFTADASHEMRTPLSVLRAQAEHALRKERSPSEYREGFENCLRATLRMTHVVEQLLALARADAGEVRVAREPVDLDALVNDAVRETYGEAASARVTVSYTAHAVTVRGDEALLHEVVVNLLSNAIRYNKSGGRVHVALRPEAEWCVLTVEDDGEGIPADALPHVFERFFRVDLARTRERGGSGLGLSITQRIVEAHGGSIAASSRLGEGSVFTVTLPRNPHGEREPA